MRELQTILNLTTINTINDFKDVMKQVRKYFRITKNKMGRRYFNVPCSFDIETSNTFSEQSEKIAFMYEWSFCIYGAVIIGRTWNEFINLISMLCVELDLNKNKRLIIYCHNLSMEFGFFRKYFQWENVFSIKSRTPVYALTTNGVEFRCSYLLSGYNLDTLAKNLTTIKIRKLVGDLDYDLIRHSETPLSEKEIAYCVNDVKIVVAYIGECIDRDGGIDNIPLTKTGYVRKYCRNSCFYDNGVYKRNSDKRIKYRRIISKLTLDVEEYYQAKRAFQGGFTHANPFCVGKVINDVTSYDFTSSYPTVMIAEKYPMGRGELLDSSKMKKSEFYKNLRNYCCIFEVELFDVEPIVFYENYLSISRCREVVDPIINNGRVVSAKHLKTTITEQDYLIMLKFYKWDKSKMRIANFRRYFKDYLPKDFILSILELYNNKTKLKGVQGMEQEYLNSKEMLNSCYGMTVTDIVRDEIEYINNMWPDERQEEYIDPVEEYNKACNFINKYNNDHSRFLFYLWGCYVTAYARRNLFSGIIEFGTDYIYSDTDSIKVINAKKHESYISEYNKRITAQLYNTLNHYNINADLICPKTIKGVNKPLGVWDFDGHYSRFKTLGAKRYLVEYSIDNRNGENKNKMMLTVSGINKKVGIEYLKSISDDPFKIFDDKLYFPAGHTGKLTHTYIDRPIQGYIIDYLGNRGEYSEQTFIHLYPADYSLSLSRDFVSYIRDIRTE